MARPKIKTTDIKLDENLDIEWVNGDFSFVDSETENFEAIFDSFIGDYKTNVQIGMDLPFYLNGNVAKSKTELSRQIRKNLQLDGWDTTQFSLSDDIANNELKINANGIRIR
jgi:hypothetical protein